MSKCIYWDSELHHHWDSHSIVPYIQQSYCEYFTSICNCTKKEETPQLEPWTAHKTCSIGLLSQTQETRLIKDFSKTSHSTSEVSIWPFPACEMKSTDSKHYYRMRIHEDYITIHQSSLCICSSGSSVSISHESSVNDDRCKFILTSFHWLTLTLSHICKQMMMMDAE